MKKTKIFAVAILCAAFVLMCCIVIPVALAVKNDCVERNKQAASETLLHFTADIKTTLSCELNAAEEIVGAMSAEPFDTVRFGEIAESYVHEKDVVLALLLEGDTVVASYPHEIDGNVFNGMNLSDFQYVFSMVKHIKAPVIETFIPAGQQTEEYFVFLQPVLDGNNYLGQVAVYREKSAVLDTFNLSELAKLGYAYELWHLNSDNGKKHSVAISDEEFDFSDGLKSTFTLPGQWFLTIKPENGWFSPAESFTVWGGAAVIGILFLLLLLCVGKILGYRYDARRARYVDSQSGLLNRTGFLDEMSKRPEKHFEPFALFYVFIDNYNRISQICTSEEKKNYLNKVKKGIAECVASEHILGRIGEGTFVVAVFDDMDEFTLGDLARRLTIEFLQTFEVTGQKNFLNVRCQYVNSPRDGTDAEKLLEEAAFRYFENYSKQSPVVDLTNNVRQLIRGKSDVVFENYDDSDLTDLSKAIHRYHKKVEQLAYQDPAYPVGNRTKYVRDARMMIAYDRKRKFTLYCIDICAFGKYNELFSVETGDKILYECCRKFYTIFQDNLYRINGDVFLGIIQDEVSVENTLDKIFDLLGSSIEFGSMKFVLDAKCGVCSYPQHARTAEELLEYAQTAVRFAKEQSKRYVVYDEKLTEILRYDAKILKSLEDSLEHNTVEVFYQPVYDLSKEKFVAAEALLRLADGNGGYFPTNKVIELAEKNRLTDRIGNSVLRQACEFMKEYGEELGLEHICVNVSVQQLLSEDSFSNITEPISKNCISFDRICLEITETYLIQSLSYIRDILVRLGKTGIRIALDDFGTGYSSLNYLSNLPVDILKIDRRMTLQAVDSEKQLSVLKAVIEMAKLNDIIVVTEGVEFKEELDVIKETGTNRIQGFYFSKPLPKEKLIEFLRGNRN